MAKTSPFLSHLAWWVVLLLLGFGLVMASGWGLVANPGYGQTPFVIIMRYAPLVLGFVLFGAAFIRLFVIKVPSDVEMVDDDFDVE